MGEYVSESPKEDEGDLSVLHVESDSNVSSKIIDTVVIRSNRQYRISLQLSVINNDEHPDCPLKGKIIVEKKKHSDEWDREKISVGDLRAGEYFQIPLELSELHDLHKKLTQLYDSFSSSDGGSFGNYVKYDGTPESVRAFFDSDPFLTFRERKNPKRNELINLFSRLICGGEYDAPVIELLSEVDLSSTESVKSILDVMTMSEDLRKTLGEVDPKYLSKIDRILNISQLEKVRSTIHNHLYCGDEKRWQKYFEDNVWVLEQLFNCPHLYFYRELETGVTDYRGRGSNTTDFAFTHGFSNEVAIIEVKPPTAKLIDNPTTPYRNHVYTISKDITNGVSQVLRNRYNLLMNYNAKKPSTDDYTVFQPKCILLAGSYESIKTNPDHVSTFELYRNNLHGVRVVTYDELLLRIDSVIDLVSCKIKDSIPLIITDDQEIND